MITYFSFFSINFLDFFIKTYDTFYYLIKEKIIAAVSLEYSKIIFIEFYWKIDRTCNKQQL